MDECIIDSDLEKVQEMMESLSQKYEENFSCIVIAGMDHLDNDQVVCSSCTNVNGNYNDMRYLMEILLQRPTVLIATLDVIGETFANSIKDDPDFMKRVKLEVMENIKMKVTLQNKEVSNKLQEFKEERQAKEAVDNFLNDFYNQGS